MKKLLAVFLSLAMLLSLAACGNSGTKQPAGTTDSATNAPANDATETTGTPAPEGVTEVTWWSSFGETNTVYLQKIIDAFNESQDKYHVTYVFQGSAAELLAKIQSTAQADLPAMFSGPVENIALYSTSSFCAPLQSFIDADPEGWPELETTWEAIRTAYCDNEGNQIGYPIGYSYGGIFYNIDMFEEAGIAASQIKSLDDIYEASAKLVNGGYTTYGIGFHPSGFYFNAILGREGLQGYDNDNGYSGERITECLYTTDTAVHDAVYHMLDIYRKLHAENLCIAYGTNAQGEVIPQVAAGDCAMMMGVVSLTTKILNTVDGAFELGIIPLPSITENGQRTGEAPGGTGSWVCNNGRADEMQGAYEFIKFASTGEWAAYFATCTGYLAPNQQAYESEVYQDYMNNTFPAINVVYESLANSDDSALNPYIPILTEMNSANNLLISTVATDLTVDIDDAMQVAVDTINEAIELHNLANP